MTSPVTTDDFFTRFPQFADADEDQVQTLLTEASRQVDTDNWAADDVTPAILYLTAHLYTLETATVEQGDQPVVASESFGPMSVSYANPNAAATGAVDEMQTTTYGRRFTALRKRNLTGPVLI